ncbi:MAG: extracellular solute-binding protein [Gorillibacterium sp.]|nr:extracellular solute-binding protein [Gorillibacterium sp.]
MKGKWLVLPVIASLLLTTACSGGKSTTENTAKSSTAPAASAEAKNYDPFAPFPETVTFTSVKSTSVDPKFPAGESYDKNAYNDFMMKKLNVNPKILWALPSDGEAFKNKIELSVAANDLPDILQIGGDATYIKNMVKRLVEADMIEDLTDVIKNYASPKVKAGWEQNNNGVHDFLAIDGKNYVIPNQMPTADFPLVWIRDDWRKKLNLPEPKSIEDVVAIAKAFKEKDPAGGGKTVPLALQMQNDPIGMFGGSAFFSYFSSFPRSFYKADDGKVVYGGIEPQAKEALGFLAQFYKDGLIEKDFALKDGGKVMELLSGGTAGIVSHSWYGPWYPLNNTLNNDKTADWTPYALQGKNGKLEVTAGTPVGTIIVVKKGFKYPELAMKWVNVWTENKDEEWTIELYNGLYKDAVEKNPILFGLAIDSTDKELKKAARLRDALDGKMTRDQLLTFDERDAYDQISKFKEGEKDPENNTKNMPGWQNYKAWILAMNAINGANPNIIYKAYEGKTPTMEKNMTALESLQMNVYLKIIMGKEPIEAFDKFVTDWKAQGGDEILEEVNKEVSGK